MTGLLTNGVVLLTILPVAFPAALKAREERKYQEERGINLEELGYNDRVDMKELRPKRSWL